MNTKNRARLSWRKVTSSEKGNHPIVQGLQFWLTWSWPCKSNTNSYAVQWIHKKIWFTNRQEVFSIVFFPDFSGFPPTWFPKTNNSTRQLVPQAIVPRSHHRCCVPSWNGAIIVRCNWSGPRQGIRLYRLDLPPLPPAGNSHLSSTLPLSSKRSWKCNVSVTPGVSYCIFTRESFKPLLLDGG